MELLKTPSIDANDEDWNLYSYQSGEVLIPHLAEFLTERFSYNPRYVKQKIWRTGPTVSTYTSKYDLYFRLFLRPDDFCPRECLILARLMFKEQRAGHGRELLEMLVKLTPEFGYKFLAIECANKNAAAFGERMGFTSYENGRHWVGAVHDIQRALSAAY
ncbi:hypothetical protein K5R88_07830 [Pseudomonas sp. MM213]|uniref:hypothetical protein n=1 Tax=Pseudomonas sp. MM213 TaxID=2866807 RepID=UPI001CF335F3|nr:hypothetical protein [Pseudomonas sp. MM213]UCP11532.1 hypothetical protein K5R88_07830 [Pseudomonas sp. MM213]